VRIWTGWFVIRAYSVRFKCCRRDRLSPKKLASQTQKNKKVSRLLRPRQHLKKVFSFHFLTCFSCSICTGSSKETFEIFSSLSFHQKDPKCCADGRKEGKTDMKDIEKTRSSTTTECVVTTSTTPQTSGTGIPKDRDEVNRREVCECHGDG
jgi:hypothetical protein